MKILSLTLIFIMYPLLGFTSVDTIYLSLADTNFYENFKINPGQKGVIFNYEQQPPFDFKDLNIEKDGYYILQKQRKGNRKLSKDFESLAEGLFVRSKRFGRFKFFLFKEIKNNNSKRASFSITTQTCYFMNSKLEFENVIYEDGKPLHQFTFENDTLNGLAIYTMQNGFVYEFYKNGIKVSSRNYNNGKLTEFNSFIQDSSIQKKVYYLLKYDKIIEAYQNNGELFKIVVHYLNPNDVFEISYEGLFVSPSAIWMLERPARIELSKGTIKKCFLENRIEVDEVGRLGD